jgi:hypothetical protein
MPNMRGTQNLLCTVPNIFLRRNRMNLAAPEPKAHPTPGEEVMMMDDVDVHVCGESIGTPLLLAALRTDSRSAA